MKKWSVLLAVAMIAIVAFYPRSYEVTAVPEEGLRVTYTVKPMFGFHSDWTRAVRVEYRANEIQQELFKDTGWWRGSHLYRHKSGVYVIHEGQNGCFGFTIEPLSFEVQANISCKKNVAAQQVQRATSQYYTDLKYLGAFTETHYSQDGAPISFVPADEKPEAELPDIL